MAAIQHPGDSTSDIKNSEHIFLSSLVDDWKSWPFMSHDAAQNAQQTAIRINAARPVPSSPRSPLH
jgi:hypothetical protein